MDTTETYIKMCEKAEEIQVVAPLEFGNWYAYLRPARGKHWGLAECAPIVELIGEDWNHNPGYGYTDDVERCWLPRQDQLQEMGEDKRVELQIIVKGFCDFIHFPECYQWSKDIKKYLPKFTSMEQLWLAFVMKEKHNKVWDGENWI